MPFLWNNLYNTGPTVIHPQYYGVQAPWGLYPANLIQQQGQQSSQQILRGQNGRPLTPNQPNDNMASHTPTLPPQQLQTPSMLLNYLYIVLTEILSDITIFCRPVWQIRRMSISLDYYFLLYMTLVCNRYWRWIILSIADAQYQILAPAYYDQNGQLVMGNPRGMGTPVRLVSPAPVLVGGQQGILSSKQWAQYIHGFSVVKNCTFIVYTLVD